MSICLLAKVIRLPCLLLALCSGLLFSQQLSNLAPADPREVVSTSEGNKQTESKRLFGIIPNYRTSPSLKNYSPLTSREMFTLAGQDAFDRGTVILAAGFAGESQLTRADPRFGQGAAGFGRYFGTSYADFVIGDYMTEAILPTLLHQDPRYFRSGEGTVLRRLGYAAGQIFRTHSNRGTSQFNYSEVLGNSAAVAISMSYYPDGRNASDAVAKLGMQLGVDMASNELREFWPDIIRKFSWQRRAIRQ